MSQQPTLFSQGAPVSPRVPDRAPDNAPASSSGSPATSSPGASPRGSVQPPPHTPNWLQFLELSVRVVVRVYLGFFIVALPWTHFWTDNRFLLVYPHLAAILLNGAVRGIISGLGLLNVWIGIDDAIHYNEP